MKKNFLTLLLISCLVEVAVLTIHAQPGSLDLTFSADGKVTTNIGVDYAQGRAVAVQSDDKIVVAGSCNNILGNNDFGIVRYNSNGALDNTFSADGKAITDFGSSDDAAFGVAIQSDGKIVAGGYTGSGSTYDFALVRYTTYGGLDNTFSGDGMVTTDLGNAYDLAYALAIQGDGKIVLAGITGSFSDYKFAMVRYKDDGSLDSTFGTNGIVITDVGNDNDYAYAVAIQGDGKIVLAGESYTSGSYYDFAVVRYKTDGSPDSTFSSDGKLVTDNWGYDDAANAVAIQSDGKIVVAGYDNNFGSIVDFVVIRLDSTGALDNTFSSDGKTTTDFGDNDAALSVAIQDDGKIVAAGYDDDFTNEIFAIARYNTNGALDNTFDLDGKVTTVFGNAGEGRAVAIQGDGKIVVAGFSDESTEVDYAVARYNADFGVGIEESILSNSFIVYPNPCDGVFNLQFESNGHNAAIASVEIRNELGQRMFQKNYLLKDGLLRQQVQAGKLCAGVYTVIIRGGAEVMTQKILIE